MLGTLNFTGSGHWAPFNFLSKSTALCIRATLGATTQEIVLSTLLSQRARKVVSNSPGLVDFAINLVIIVLNLPNRQVLFFGEIQLTEGLE